MAATVAGNTVRLTVKLILVLLGVLVVAIGLIAAFAVVLPRTGGGSHSAVIEVTLEDLRFVPNRLDLRAGVTTTLRLTNRGSARQDLHFPSLHMPGLEGVESILEPGETRTVTLRFDRPGTHTFICTLPGHAAAGMTGAAYVAP